MAKKQYENVQYFSLEEIKKEIELSEVSKVCEHMVAAGMGSDKIEQLVSLISACLDHSDEWIRNAGFLALYHLNVRFRNKLDELMLIILIKRGLKDDSDIVLGAVDLIMDELHEFNFALWKKLMLYQNK